MVNKSFSLWSPLPATRPSAPTRTMSRSSVGSLRAAALPLPLSLGLILAVATIALLILYVFGINRHAAMGYELKKQQAQLNNLIEQNKKLTIRAAEVGSILRLQEEVALNNFVQVTNQEYLQVNQLSQR